MQTRTGISLRRVVVLLIVTTAVGIGLAQKAAVEPREPGKGQITDEAIADARARNVMNMRSITNVQRCAAAARAAAARRGAKAGTTGSINRQAAQQRIIEPFALTGTPPSALATPDYFGTIPNYANSPVIQKFVDSLPGLGPANASAITKQYIPIAQPVVLKNPDGTVKFPNDDYYEIGLVDDTTQFHPNLPPTKIRGYIDLSPDADGKFHFLGPMIIAQKDRPVRLKFTNKLGTGAAGNLFLPVDTTLMGAGMGPNGGSEMYTQNRAVIHLHGGNTPWISDGTPHQWITPAGESTSYKKGVSQQNVPDIGDPGDGSATYYYTNQQSGRLMFYHDHALGTTRLNVYAGEAAGYLLTDPTEDKLIGAGLIPGAPNGDVYRYGIPLIIQDKTFVPDATTLARQDPTWDTAHWGGLGSLWFPHVYMPNQNPADAEGVNAMGRWDYGPWFWPPQTTLTNGPITLANGTQMPGTPNPSQVPEAFMDTPVVNGAAYPYLTVQRKAYRFRILNAANDRSFNLQLYYADASGTEVKMVNAWPHDGSTTPPLCTSANSTSSVTGLPTGCWPTTWPTDARDGGVPDPAAAGPAIIQIGTEGGLLPAPVVIPSNPVNYEYNRRNIVVLNVTNHALFLGPAERADVIIDFSSVPDGSKLILYNDAPAPVPAFDSRYDYYTGDPDQTSTGGAPTTTAGFGPNTRTIMQFRVSDATPNPQAFNVNALAAAFKSTSTQKGPFAESQPAPLVPQAAYGTAYNTTYTDTFSRIQNTSLTFTPIDPATGLQSGTPIKVDMKAKTIQELFDADYGRMNSTLGTELPLTSFLNQTTIPLAYVDPPTEIIKDREVQIWKITHNGVDTHAIHFHLFNVQLINRVGWDGQIRPPEPNEIGWKETVRMNPLEDAIVALQPISQGGLPFSVPDSVRPLNPAEPIGSNKGFTGVDPYTNAPITVTNQMTNFGWEYVWHCHLLGHEENDMMRPIVVQVTPPASASNLSATAAGPTQVNLSWTYTGPSTGVTLQVQRATGAGAFTTIGTVPTTQTTYNDTGLAPSTSYSYQIVVTSNTTATSNTVTVKTPLNAPTNLVAGLIGTGYVILSWADTNISGASNFVVYRGVYNAATQTWSAYTLVATTAITTNTYRNTGLVSKTQYRYYVQAIGAGGAVSASSNVVTITAK